MLLSNTPCIEEEDGLVGSRTTFVLEKKETAWLMSSRRLTHIYDVRTIMTTERGFAYDNDHDPLYPIGGYVVMHPEVTVDAQTNLQ